MTDPARGRAPHTHLTQADPSALVDGCPACALIRNDVMSRGAIGYLRAGAVIYGPTPRPTTRDVRVVRAVLASHNTK